MTQKPHSDTPEFLDIDITRQQLTVFKLGKEIISYPISTAKNGAGELKGSECTPRGWHSIRAKIGADQPLHSVFIGRRATGEIYSPELAKLHPQRDWILTRILWLGGLEPHKNRYGNVDSTWRYIYIHGCPDDTVTGIPQSHGCIRMRNNDLLELFNRIAVGIKVYIHE
ncbi:MAG: L,D-transpeptidase [Methylococcales bacterium]|nr:MAG: L,D-transpeptidase [Methylococcales bacterium]